MRYRLECPANRYVFKSRLNCSESTAGSLRQSGSEFQTVGPATEKAHVPKVPCKLLHAHCEQRNLDDSHKPNGTLYAAITFLQICDSRSQPQNINAQYRHLITYVNNLPISMTTSLTQRCNVVTSCLQKSYLWHLSHDREWCPDQCASSYTHCRLRING